MSDLENELLGLAEEEPRRKRSKAKSEAYADSSEEEDDPNNASEGEEEMDMDMDMELESEEGEGSEDEAPARPARPAPVKRTSSSSKAKKEKVVKGKAVKSKGKAVKSSGKGNGAGNGADEGAGKRNPYPLEGKYIDEDDRDRLEDLPEIEREEILAGRQEEMQKFKDAQALDAMFQSAGGISTTKRVQLLDDGDDEEEDMDMDIDEDDEDDDEPSRKRRKHTSVTKETSRAINQLQKVRRKRHENAERRAEKFAQSSAAGLLDDDEHSSEDGEIDDTYDSYAADKDRDRQRGRGGDRDNDYDPHRGGSTDRSPERDRRNRRGASAEEDEDAEMDKMPASTMDLNAARVSRYEMVEGMYKAGFQDAMVGAYVRFMAPEPDADGRPKYRIHRIKALQRRAQNRYPVEYKDRTIYEDWVVLCTYGNGRREYRVADISNGDFTNNEYGRFRQTSEADRVPIPKPSELKRIHQKLQELKARPMTNAEINAQVANRRAGATPTASLARLDVDPNAGHAPPSRGTGAVTANAQADARKAELEALSEHDRRVAQINESKKKRVKENMQKAHAGMMARRKAEEAMIRQKEAEARAKAADIEAIETDNAKKVEEEAAAGGIRKGETPQQYVARTVELDLGDF